MSVNRISRATVPAPAGGAAVLGSTGGAFAHEGGRGASAERVAVKSPGVASGNVLQFAFDVPINVCGNTLNVLFGIANAAIGNTCINK
jgi:hypothetical protein